MKMREKDIHNERDAVTKKLMTEVEECRFHLTTRSQEAHTFAEEATRLKAEIA